MIDSRISQLGKSQHCPCVHRESKNCVYVGIDSAARRLLSAVIIHQVSLEPSGPISSSHTAPTPLWSSIHQHQRCLWLQTRQGTSQHNIKPFQTHQEIQSPRPPLKSKVIFLSLFFLGWSSKSSYCNLQSAAVSEKDARCFLVGVLAALASFLWLTRFPKNFTFPYCSWSESSPWVFCLWANSDIFKTVPSTYSE